MREVSEIYDSLAALEEERTELLERESRLNNRYWLCPNSVAAKAIDAELDDVLGALDENSNQRARCNHDLERLEEAEASRPRNWPCVGGSAG